MIREGAGGLEHSLSSAIKVGYQIEGEEATTPQAPLGPVPQAPTTLEGTAAVKSFLQQSMVAITGNDIDFLEAVPLPHQTQYESDIQGTPALDENGFESMMIQASLDT